MKGHLSLKAWNNLRYQAVLLIRADVAFCSFAPIRPLWMFFEQGRVEFYALNGRHPVTGALIRDVTMQD